MHYVALDKILDIPPDEGEEFIDNENVHEGDEHHRKITGGPSESFMTLENPEAEGQIYSVAPAEGQRPLSIITDDNFACQWFSPFPLVTTPLLLLYAPPPPGPVVAVRQCLYTVSHPVRVSTVLSYLLQGQVVR